MTSTATITTVLMIIFVFAFVPLVLAEIARKKSLPTIENFFLQDRNMSLFLVFFTVYSTWVSSFAFLGSASHFYMNGPVYMTAFAWNALFGILFMIIGKRLWFYGKQNGYITPTDFFADIYDSRPLSILVTLVMLIFTLPYLQIQLSGGAYLIETATDGMIPWRVSGLIFYLIIIIYLWAGGLRAVAMTDVFYGILIFITMIGIGFYSMSKAGGVEFVFEKIYQIDQAHLVLKSDQGPDKVISWLSMFLIVPIGALMGPPIWLRAYASRDIKTFNIMPFLLTLVTIMYLGSLLAGSAAIILEPNMSQSDAILPKLLTKSNNILLMAVFFCGIAAAALSTANSQIHAVAAIYTIDIHKKYINNRASEAKLVNIGKWAVLLISAVAYLLMFGGSQGLIIETGTIAMGGTAQILVPTLGALYWKHSNATGACWGLATGVVILLLLNLVFDLSASFSGVIALLMNGFIFLLVSWHTGPQLLTRTKIYDYRMAYENKHLL